MDKIEELLTRGVANIIPGKDALVKLLETGKKLNIYLGIDPTSIHIHLGHAFNLRKLQQFTNLGHNVTFLIGDFTALIGDTSDKDTERPILTSEQIHANFQTYKKQAEKLLDFSQVRIVHNSEWLRKLTFEEIIKLTQHFAVGDFVGRELIRKRLLENKRVGLHEMLYPIMQGYDSYHMDTDIQIGGTDQTFNMQAGRTLQKDLRGKDSSVITSKFLPGTDGRKMSKSWGNAIWLDDSPSDIYTKVMAIRDELIIQYFTLATNLPLVEIKELEQRLDNNEEHPMQAKKKLAATIVEELHSKTEAEKAAQDFQKIVQKKEFPSEIPIIPIHIQGNFSFPDGLVILQLAESISEAKRLIEQGGVTLDGEKISDPHSPFTPKNGSILKVGKRKIVKLQVE